MPFCAAYIAPTNPIGFSLFLFFATEKKLIEVTDQRPGLSSVRVPAHHMAPRVTPVYFFGFFFSFAGGRNGKKLKELGRKKKPIKEIMYGIRYWLHEYCTFD